MNVPTRRQTPADASAYRSVPTRNLVRILSGEMPTERHTPRARARAVAREAPLWQRVLRVLGLWG